jgi:hypothetical protein
LLSSNTVHASLKCLFLIFDRLIERHNSLLSMLLFLVDEVHEQLQLLLRLKSLLF